ncbi:hypothetical protein J3F84DRAFT_350268 [Trichoderma pleuroticola]
MHYIKIILAVTPLSAFAVQLSLPGSDVPSACQDTCQAIMDVANSCANSHNGGDTSNIDQIIKVCHINGDASGGGNGPSTTHQSLVASTTAVVAPPMNSGTTSAGGHTNTPTSPPAVVTGAAAVGTVANGGLMGLIAMAAARAIGMGI